MEYEIHGFLCRGIIMFAFAFASSIHHPVPSSAPRGLSIECHAAIGASGGEAL